MRSVLIITALFSQSFALRPVVLLHGIMTGSECMDMIKDRILETHPDIEIFNIGRFDGWSSLDNMWYQVQQIGNDVMNISSNYPKGVNFIGYSQGALLGRAILQAFPEHNVHNYISLSGPQAGQYGTAFLHIIFPGLALKSAFELFYSHVGQHTSVGNYWNDPFHQELYYSYSQFLPFINNEVLTNRSAQFKEGLMKLNKLVLIGGPDDDVITPWQSSQFGYYDDNDTVVSLEEREIFQKDLIGLKSLHDKKKLDIITVSGVSHFMWHLNKTIVDKYLMKYLD